jgi:hypothetical protein
MSNASDTTTAKSTARAVHDLSAAFMLDPATYQLGAELGFKGIDFYFAGRAGVLGDVCADIVTSAAVFFAPDQVTAAWEASRDVMSRAEASNAFAGCMASWGAQHLGDSVDWSRLARLAGKIADAASLGGAPLFAGWRNQTVEGDTPIAALAAMNLLRELRMARHGSAVVALGIDPADAVRHRSPHMLGIFGWDSGELPQGFAQTWDEAEQLTDRATAHDYGSLTSSEAAEFVALCTAALADLRI